jgi:hypothetical protein
MLKEDDVSIFTVRDERNSSFRDPTAWLRLVINKIHVKVKSMKLTYE